MKSGDKFVNNSGLSLTIDSYVSNVEVYVSFDVTGYKTKARKCDIINGKVRDRMHPSMYGIGFDTGEKYKTRRSKGYFSKAYTTWKNMLKRCYGKSEREKHKSYDSCFVSTEWHNFQNFAEWFEVSYPKIDGDWQLDKDKLSGESKVYSPSTCCFISRKENMDLVDNKVSITIKNKESGEVKSFNSMSDAVKYTGSDSGTMTRLKQGKCNSTKGWVLA